MVFPIIKALERQIFLRVFSQLFSNIYTNLWISFINLHFCHKHLVASSDILLQSSTLLFFRLEYSLLIVSLI
jgi:hypothetical protein